MTTLYLDLETYSATPIANGTHVYAADAEIMLFAYALDDAPVQVWDCTANKLMPDDLCDALEDESITLCAHNSHFDRTVLHHAGHRTNITRWVDTMVQAMAHSLPGGLGLLSEILKLKEDEAKDKRGKELVLLFCKPRPKTFDYERATSFTHPQEWAEFISYAGRDIDAMRTIAKKLPTWNSSGQELALWHLDQTINQRGFMVDIDLARSAISAVEIEQARLAERTQELTDNAVQSATQRDAVLKFVLEEHGVTLPDMKASTLERRMQDENLPPMLRELLAIRLQASTTSVSKYKALMKGVSSDSRLRGTLQFNGALRTGRYAGRTFQPQNLPRPTLRQKDIDVGIAALKAGCAELCVEDVMQLASSAIRGSIIAPSGKKLVVADLSNIEGRILAWLVGETWKLQAFAAYDRGEGHDLYNLTYAKSFRVPPETVTKAQRQVGKVEELAFGNGGGVGACITFAQGYSLDLEDFAALADDAPANIVEEAEGFLQWMYKQNPKKTESAVRYGLSTAAFIGCDVLKRMWREAHPNTTAWWGELEDAARMAIATPNKTIQCRKVKLVRTAAWLRIILPSGRSLCYPSPQVSESGQISYMGIDQYSRKWSRLTTYGGKMCIAEGTLVLARRGWVPIEQITAYDSVWNGENWTSTDGAICNGTKEVIYAYGAYMTADHEVLTEEGWKSASQSERYKRATCRLPNGVTLPRQRREKINMGSDVRLWRGEVNSRDGVKETKSEGYRGVLRMQAQGDDRFSKCYARYEPTPSLCGVAEYGRPMSLALASSVGELWRAGNNSVRRMARVVRELLGGYGQYLSPWAIAGQSKQRQGLRESELSLGNKDRASQQSPKVDTCGRQDSSGAIGTVRYSKDDHRVPFETRVYDLTNCGHLSRFVIATEHGPLIVHNCENITQAVARDVLLYNMPDVEVAGYEIVLSVHDELITETPDSAEYSAEGLAALMSTNKPWAKGLPLAAAGFETYRYRKE